MSQPSVLSSQQFSDILTPDMQQELFQSLDSQFADVLNDTFDGPYANDIYTNNGHDPVHDETTMSLGDIKMGLDDYKNYLPQAMPQLQAIPANQVLSNDEYPGPFEFEVTILPTYKSKNPWVYSSELNKVYMDISQQFPVDFKIKDRPGKQLFIRTTPQYCAQHHAMEPVARCIQHEYPGDPTNKDVQEHVRQHVIRCTNKLSQYLGNKKENQRLSIIFPFSMPQAGVESVREMFYFVCKSSCNTPGMNRRGIEVIFTLEDENGLVLGRKCLNVRICACPKRDKEKEEKELNDKTNGPAPRGKKRKLDNPPANPGKVLSQHHDDLKDYTVNLTVTGKNNLSKILAYAEDLNLAGMMRHQGQGGLEKFRRNLTQIQQFKNSLQ